MTVIQPNSVAGINSITVQSGDSLSVHKSDGSLIRTITADSGITTFSKVSISGVTTQFGQINFGTAGTASTIFANGNAAFSGIVTASSYFGDGSNLSNITSTTINGNTDDRIITGSDTANTLNAESTFIYTGSRLGINITGGSITDVPATSHDTVVIGNSSMTSGGICLEGSSSSGNLGFQMYKQGSFLAARVLYEYSTNELQFHSATGASPGAGEAVRLQLKPGGNVLISDGDLEVASGHGIDFSATADGSGVSNSSEVLDDYEEGQWTGAIVTGTANINDEWYVKIGRLVIGGGNITAISDTSSSNQINVTGLPFSVSGGESGVGAVGASKNSAFSEVVTTHVTGTTVYFMKSSTSTGSHDYLKHSDQVQSSGSLTFGFNYYTA